MCGTLLIIAAVVCSGTAIGLIVRNGLRNDMPACTGCIRTCNAGKEIPTFETSWPRAEKATCRGKTDRGNDQHLCHPGAGKEE